MVMDLRSFRPNWVRKNEQDAERDKNESRSYEAFERALETLSPKVIISCQRIKNGNGMPEVLCSVGKKSGETPLWTMPNGHKTIIVDSFHPGWIYHENKLPNHQKLQEAVSFGRERLFEASFVVAANLLTERTIMGNGIQNLNSLATRGPKSYWVPLIHDESDLEETEIDEILELMGLLTRLAV